MDPVGVWVWMRPKFLPRPGSNQRRFPEFQVPAWAFSWVVIIGREILIVDFRLFSPGKSVLPLSLSEKAWCGNPTWSCL